MPLAQKFKALPSRVNLGSQVKLEEHPKVPALSFSNHQLHQPH